MDTALSPRAVDWQSDATHLFLNPKLPATLNGVITQAVERVSLPGHIWLLSSGTTGGEQVKVMALAKSAFLVAAGAANAHLKVTAQDRWLNPLPIFHVGGLAIYCRAFLSGSGVVDHSGWNVDSFVQMVSAEHITLTSLVPTQVRDLVVAQKRAPASLRAVIVGGGHLEDELYLQARALGWPLLPSFGMTECCSQVATAEVSSLLHMQVPRLRLLPHIQARVVDGHLEVASPALLTGLLQVPSDSLQLLDVKKKGWLRTQDRVQIYDDIYLKPLGRADDMVKILGELVDVFALNKKLPGLTVLGVPHTRSGHVLVAVTEGSLLEAEKQVRRFNEGVMPFERIQQIYQVDAVPKTELHKVKRQELMSLIMERPVSF